MYLNATESNITVVLFESKADITKCFFPPTAR